MNVVIIGRREFDTLEFNIAETLVNMGYQACIIDVYKDIPLLRFNRSISHALLKIHYGLEVGIWKKLCKQVIETKPDWVIVTYREVVPESIRYLKRKLKGVPIVHVNPDAIINLQRQYIFMSPYDAYFTKEPFLANTMRRLYGLNAHYLPESFNPRIHVKPQMSKLAMEKETTVDLVVIANLNAYRVKFIENLLKKLNREINLVIYGSPKPFPWVAPRLMHFHGNKYIVGKEKAKAFYGAKVALNTMHPCEFYGVNCRFFEALGSGAFLLTENRPTLPQLAKPDLEVVTFQDVDEAAGKLEYYLDHEEKRLAIANAGYRRALREHTYEKRIKQMLDTLKKCKSRITRNN